MTRTQERQLVAREDAERLARKIGATVLVQEYDSPPLYRCNVEHDPAGGIIVAIVPPPHGLRRRASRAQPREQPPEPEPRGGSYRDIACACCGATGTSAGHPPKCDRCRLCDPDRDIKARTCPRRPREETTADEPTTNPTRKSYTDRLGWNGAALRGPGRGR